MRTFIVTFPNGRQHVFRALSKDSVLNIVPVGSIVEEQQSLIPLLNLPPPTGEQIRDFFGTSAYTHTHPVGLKMAEHIGVDLAEPKPQEGEILDLIDDVQQIDIKTPFVRIGLITLIILTVIISIYSLIKE